MGGDFLSLPDELLSLIFDFVGLHYRGRCSLSCKALSGATLWRLVSKLRLPLITPWTRHSDRKFIKTVPQDVLNLLTLHGRQLREIHLRNGLESLYLKPLLLARGRQITHLDIPNDHPIAEDLLSLFNPDIVHMLKCCFTSVYGGFKSFFEQNLKSLTILHLRVRSNFLDVLSRLALAELPKLAELRLESTSGNESVDLSEEDGPLAKFTRAHSKSLIRVCIIARGCALGFQGIECHDTSIQSMKDACARMERIFGIPLRCVRLEFSSAFIWLTNNSSLDVDLMNAYKVLHGVLDEPERPLTREEAIGLCLDLYYNFTDKRDEPSDTMVQFLLEEAARIRRICPAVLRSDNGFHIFFHVCRKIMHELQDEKILAAAWDLALDCFEYDHLNLTALERSGFSRDVLSSLVQQGPERLKRIVNNTTAWYLIDLVGKTGLLTKGFVELVVSSSDPLPSHVLHSVLYGFHGIVDDDRIQIVDTLLKHLKPEPIGESHLYDPHGEVDALISSLPVQLREKILMYGHSAN